jgi:23S rRNA (uracil1939-C5)-methyltransferase
VTAEPRDVDIEGLGARGDGIATLGQEQLYVPFALPGERWRVTGGKDGDMLRAHPSRATPICRHFGTCGGCVAQHMPDDIYVDWKRRMVVDAFRHRGIDAPVEALLRVPAGSRRRVTLYAKRYDKEVRLGFHRAATHDILDVAECPIAVPGIVNLLPALRGMLQRLLPGRAEAAITVLATPSGLDVGMVLAHTGSMVREYPRLAAWATRHGIARLTLGEDTVAETRQPVLTYANAEVHPPPRAFAQAVTSSEAQMIRLVTTAADKARRIGDLFCGIGTFALPLARQARVLAVDSNEPAVAALGAAARRAQGLKPIEAKVRDLFRTPLSARELEGFDAVVLDPARAGAQAQAAQIAASDVGLVIYVSCDPGTLARDARILIDGGCRLERVTPIDQFLYAAHVEVVAVFKRERQRKPARMVSKT